MTGQEVVDIAYNTCAAVTRVRIDTAFLTVAANLAGIGGVHVLADDIAFIIEGVGGRDHIVRSLALVRILLLGSCYESSGGCYGIGISRLRTNGVVRTVFGYAIKAVAAERVGYLVNLIAGRILKCYVGGLIRGVSDYRLLAIGISNTGKQVARIGVVDRSKVGCNNGEQLTARIVGEAELTTCTVGYRGNAIRGVGDVHMVSGCIGDLNESTGYVKLIGILTLLESKLNGVVEHISAVYILEEIVALRIAVAAYLRFALFEEGFLAVFSYVDVTGARRAFVDKVGCNHTLHNVELKAVAKLHCRERGSCELDSAVVRVGVTCKCAVEEMLDGDRHSVTGPSEVLRLKHKVSTLEIHGALTESAKLVSMSTVRGVYTIARFVGDNDLGSIVTAVGATVKSNVVLRGDRLVEYLENKLRIS